MQKEACNKLFDEKLNEIQEMCEEIDYKNLAYNFTSKTIGSINFTKSKGPFGLLNEIKEGNISSKMAEEDQEKFKRELRQIKSGNPKHKVRNSHIQQKMLNIFTIRDKKNIDLFNDYSEITSESIYRSRHDETKQTGLKILTPKQILQRLPIALAQVKVGSNSESLLNEIRQFVYSLCQPKQITKKVYNNIIKSI